MVTVYGVEPSLYMYFNETVQFYSGGLAWFSVVFIFVLFSCASILRLRIAVFPVVARALHALGEFNLKPVIFQF